MDRAYRNGGLELRAVGARYVEPDEYVALALAVAFLCEGEGCFGHGFCFYLFVNDPIALQRYKNNVTNNVTQLVFYETLIKPLKITIRL